MMYLGMTFRSQYILPCRYKSYNFWCWCSLHSHHKHGLHCCIHRHLEGYVMWKRAIKQREKNKQKEDKSGSNLIVTWQESLLQSYLPLGKYRACRKKLLLLNNLMLQMLKVFLTLDPHLLFLTIAVARGTEFEMRDESALVKIVIGKGVFLWSVQLIFEV